MPEPGRGSDDAGRGPGKVVIRPATADDAGAVATIYNQGIADRIATLETERRTAEERQQWLAARGPRHPVLVAEGPNGVVGWGSLNEFNTRAVYDHVADLSVYVERSWRGRGVGRLVLGRLVVVARELGYHKIVLAAFPSNAAGLALYRHFGFVAVGVYHEQGLLDGEWIDVLIMERLL